MPSTYTSNLGLEKPATGEQAGTWGQTANKSYDFLDTATDGNLTVILSASSYTLVTDPGNLSEGRNKIIVFTGTITNTGTINIKPNTAEKIYIVTNATDGGFDLVFKADAATGPTFTLKNGRSAIIYANGQGGVSGVAGAIDNLQLNSLQIIGALTIGGAVNFGSPTTFTQPVTFNAAATFAAAATFNAAATFTAGVTANTATVTGATTTNSLTVTTSVAAASLAVTGGVTAGSLTVGSATTSALTLNIGGDQAWDLLYRSGAGPLARLGIGANGQLLGVTGGAISWGNIGIGALISGGANQCVLFVDAAAHLAQDGNFRWAIGGGLTIAGGLGLTVTGSAAVGGNATITGSASVGNGLTVTGNVNITGQYQVNGLAFQNNWVGRALAVVNTVIRFNSWTDLVNLALPFSGTYAVFIQFYVTQGGMPQDVFTEARVLAGGVTDIGITAGLNIPAAIGIFTVPGFGQGTYTGGPTTLTFQGFCHANGGATLTQGNIMAIWVSP